MPVATKKTALRFLVSTFIILLLFPAVAATEDLYDLKRRQMVERDIRDRGLEDPVVLKVMGKVPRHLFIDESLRSRAYGDHPLPIGEGQTISQPYVVALMTAALRLTSGDRVLEIGTGSGYQAAVLAEIVKEVYTVEIRKSLADKAAAWLASLGFSYVEVMWGVGFFGWEAEAGLEA